MQQWTASYSFQWTPIITFSTRRLHLLDWFEKNTDPLAFFEDSSKVGVAVYSSDLKLTVTRSGLVIDNGDGPNVDVEVAAEAVSGILTTLEPSNVTLAHSAQALSRPLDDVSYEQAAASFARRMVGAADGDFVAKDASALADLESDGWHFQPEWGVVTDTELVDRIENPEISRGGALRPSTKLNPEVVDFMPEVSVFVDVMTHPSSPLILSDSDGIISSIAKVDMVTELLAEHVAEAMEGDVK